MPLKVNVDGRVWSIRAKWSEPVVDDGDGMVIIGKNRGEMWDFLRVDGIERDMFTYFLYGLKDGQLYYMGEDPMEPSGGMVIKEPYLSALHVPKGTRFSARAEFDTTSYVMAHEDEFGLMRWTDEDPPSPPSRGIIDSAFTARQVLDAVDDPVDIVNILLEAGDFNVAQEPQIAPSPEGQTINRETLTQRARLVLRHQMKIARRLHHG